MDSFAKRNTKLAMRKKKKKEKRERERDKRRIRKKRRRCLEEKEGDGRALRRWRRVATTVRIFHNSTLGFGMLAYKFASAVHFFFSSPLFLSFFSPRSRRFANFYNLPAADTARAITFERISRNGEYTRASFFTCKLKIDFFATFPLSLSSPQLKIPYFLTRLRIKEIEMVDSNFFENASCVINRIHLL